MIDSSVEEESESDDYLAIPQTIVVEEAFLKKIIIASDNPYKSKFDALILLLVAYSCIMSLYNSAFTAPTNKFAKTWDWIVEGMFYTDLILNFFHSYRDPETLNPVEEIGKIARHYFYGWFIIDFFACFPF